MQFNIFTRHFLAIFLLLRLSACAALPTNVSPLKEPHRNELGLTGKNSNAPLFSVPVHLSPRATDETGSLIDGPGVAGPSDGPSTSQPSGSSKRKQDGTPLTQQKKQRISKFRGNIMSFVTSSDTSASRPSRLQPSTQEIDTTKPQEHAKNLGGDIVTFDPPPQTAQTKAQHGLAIGTYLKAVVNSYDGSKLTDAVVYRRGRKNEYYVVVIVENPLKTFNSLHTSPLTEVFPSLVRVHPEYSGLKVLLASFRIRLDIPERNIYVVDSLEVKRLVELEEQEKISRNRTL